MTDEAMDEQVLHDLREGLALSKGWLELLFRNWDAIDDVRRREMVAGALFGANRVAFVLDMLDGREPDSVVAAEERMAEEYRRLGEITA
jgi:hypothetical protein